MNGKRVGYIRVSSLEQNPDRQMADIKADKVFIDKCSGKDTNRPALVELMDYVREGDKVVVYSMDRLARNLDDLRRIVKELNQKDVSVDFIKEGLVFTGEDSPMANLLLSVMGAFAEFERSLIRERQKEGIEIAKKRGIYKGRKPALSAEQINALQLKASYGVAKTKLAQEFNISRETVYKYLRTEEVEGAR